MPYTKPEDLTFEQKRYEEHLGHPVEPWAWSKGKSRENQVTEGIWHLLDPAEVRELADLVANLFLDALPRELEHLRSLKPLWGWQLQARFGPDLVLADEDDVVRVVVEHKRKARAQAPALHTVAASGELFDEQLAQDTWSEVTQHSVAGPHPTPADPRTFTCCWAHTQPRDGMVHAAMWQIDAYRCTPGWASKKTFQVSPDPNGVAWIFLDAQGRAADEVFEGSLTAAQWHTLSHAQLASGLLDWLMSDSSADGSPVAVQRVHDALRMLFTD